MPWLNKPGHSYSEGGITGSTERRVGTVHQNSLPKSRYTQGRAGFRCRVQMWCANFARKCAGPEMLPLRLQSVRRLRFRNALHWRYHIGVHLNILIRAATASLIPLYCLAAGLQPPRAGKVEIMKASDVKPGMKAIAWTVFEGDTPEAVPIEIIGNWKNMWGPGQDVILGKMGGNAERTNVAGGMSGSPVYIDGKLIGAVALRLSPFSPDAICGITPIELMLEINEFDKSRPADARTPDKSARRSSRVTPPNDLLARVMAAGVRHRIASPVADRHAAALLRLLTTRCATSRPSSTSSGVTPVQGGAGSALKSTKPVAGWQHALHPGQTVAGVLVSGDMSVTGLGTVTYNDGKHILAFGHPFFNLGPVDMPMSKGEVLMMLGSPLPAE